jgi:hypothetical protein
MHIHKGGVHCAMRKRGGREDGLYVGRVLDGLGRRDQKRFSYFSHLSGRHLVFNQLTFLLIKANSYAISIMYKMRCGNLGILAFKMRQF